MQDPGDGDSEKEPCKESSDGFAFFVDLMSYLSNKFVRDSFPTAVPDDVRLAAGNVQTQLVRLQTEFDALVDRIRQYHPQFLADKLDIPTLADILNSGFRDEEDDVA